MSLLTHLATIDDPRRDINKKHELLDLLFLTVSAVMSGAEGWKDIKDFGDCLLYTSPSPRDRQKSRMPSSA